MEIICSLRDLFLLFRHYLFNFILFLLLIS